MREIETLNFKKAGKKKNKNKKKKWDPNPWAVCHTNIDKDKNPEKFERCVLDVKKKQEKDSKTIYTKNWFKSLILKEAHYSEPEEKGEGYGKGVKQFGDRKLDEWINEHEDEVRRMKTIIKAQDWVAFERYKQALEEKYVGESGSRIIKSIISAAANSIKF